MPRLAWVLAQSEHVIALPGTTRIDHLVENLGASALQLGADVLQALVPYAQSQLARGVPLRAIARHVLGLYHGCSGGRRFRQILSDAAKLKNAGPDLFAEALAAVEPTVSLA